MLTKHSIRKGVNILTILALLLGLIGLSRVEVAYAWATDQHAESVCIEGSANINVSFTNTEPEHTGFAMAMIVVATDQQTGGSVDLGVVMPGDTVEATIYTGLASIAAGTVRFDLAWADGHNNGETDTRWADYDAQNCFNPQYSVHVRADCEIGKAVVSTNVPGTFRWWLTLDGEDMGSGEEHITEGMAVGVSWNLQDYGPHSVRVYATFTPDDTNLPPTGDVIELESLTCGPARAEIVVSVSCDGIRVTGYTDIATTVYWTFQDQTGSESVDAGDFDFMAGEAITSFGPHDISGEASMTVEGQVYSYPDFRIGLTCAPAQGRIEVTVSCDGVAVAGFADMPTIVSWSFQDQTGVVPVSAGEFSFTRGDALTTYGPHDLSGEATMAVVGATYHDEDALNGATCGLPQASINVSVSCDGLNVSGHTDVATSINWTFQNEGSSTEVPAGDFNFLVGTALTGYGPHDIAGSASMTVGDVPYEDADALTGVNCGSPTATINVAVSCNGILVTGHTDVASTVHWTFQGQSADQPVQAGDFSFSAGEALTSYGPHDLVGSATLMLGDTLVTDRDSLAGATCGTATINVEVTVDCNGAMVSGHTDVPGELHVAGTLPNGETYDQTFPVPAGDYNVPIDWADVTTYGPHSYRLQAELNGAGMGASDVAEGELTCGPARLEISVTVDCDGMHVTGFAYAAGNVAWTFQDESNSVDVAAGDFNFTVGTALTTYGPHEVAGSATLTVNGESASDREVVADLPCGPALADITVSVTCNGMLISGHTDVASDITWTFQGESSTSHVEAGDYTFTVGTALTSYGPHDLSGSATLVAGNITDSDAKTGVNCGEKPEEPCKPDGTAPVDIKVFYMNPETGAQPIELQHVRLVVENGGTYEGQTNHEGWVRLHVRMADWSKNSHVEYVRDGREAPVEWSEVRVEWTETSLFGFWECALATGSIYLDVPNVPTEEVEQLAAAPCPDCPPAVCLLAEGKYVETAGTFAGVKDGAFSYYSSAEDAEGAGLTYAGAECSLCLLGWGPTDSVFFGPGSTAWDTSLRLAELRGHANLTNDDVADGLLVSQAWHDAGYPSSGLWVALTDLDAN